MKSTPLSLIALLAGPALLPAQQQPDVKTGGHPKVHVQSHIGLDGFFRVGGVEIESELSRPYVYVSRMLDEAGFSIISVADPSKAKVIYKWRIEDIETRKGLGGENGRYFKTRGRYYYAKTLSFDNGTNGADLGAAIFDVTGLPNAATVKEVRRLHGGGTTHIFPYKHSDGRTLLFTTPRGPFANIYDADKMLAGDPKEGFIGRVPIPGATGETGSGYHDTYVAYDPSTGQDRLYGAGAGGFHVFDVSNPEQPKALSTLIPGVVASGHTFIATPDHKYGVANIERQHWPMYIFDLKASGAAQAPFGAPLGAWLADWRDATHSSDVRWPYVFVASFEDSLQVFNMINPKNPKTVGWYYTCECEHQTGWGGTNNPHGTSVMNGAADVDIRNADGLIVLTDYNTGFWAFKMDGFDGWNGADWDMPNISSEQDWDNGPFGAPKKKTS